MRERVGRRAAQELQLAERTHDGRLVLAARERAAVLADRLVVVAFLAERDA